MEQHCGKGHRCFLTCHFISGCRRRGHDLALVLRRSSLTADQPETARQPQKASAEQSSLPPIPSETYAFHGSGPLGATHIPFRLNNGEIEITAHTNGKSVNCIVDTGCPIVFWVSWLHLTDQRTGLETTIGDAGGHTTRAQEAILNNVEIGSLELHHLPSYAITASRKSSPCLTLGNAAFAHTVLTIDYAKRELIIQPSVPTTVPVGIQNRSHALAFRWLNPDARGEAGVPCVRGTVMSRAANITIDTGWLRGIGITNSFYKQIRPRIRAHHIKVNQENINVVMGSTGVTAISSISWSLGSITRTSPAFAFNTLTDGAQAVMSPRLLKDFRMTIDYPQQKIWFDTIQPASKPAALAEHPTIVPKKA